MWNISKEFETDYGHRVWNQQLNQQYSLGVPCICKHLHGHRGTIWVYLSADDLTQGMVSDFHHLNWLKKFLDVTVDHKCIIDSSDPYFTGITGGVLLTVDYGRGQIETVFSIGDPDIRLDTIDIVVPGTDHFTGKIIDVSSLPDGPQKEVLEGFFIVDFVPTSENLSKWVYDLVNAKMSLINVKTSRIDWHETPKSRSTYTP